MALILRWGTIHWNCAPLFNSAEQKIGYGFRTNDIFFTFIEDNLNAKIELVNKNGGTRDGK